MAYYACTRAEANDHTIFLVGQDARGRYCVRENHGLIGGAFVSRAEAIRFAQDESEAIDGSVVLITPAPVEIMETVQ